MRHSELVHSFDWVVIGAGPAGIAAVGKLLDSKIAPDTIGWVDPAFTVGDLGGKWGSVPSNTKVRLFRQFLMAYQSFQYELRPSIFPFDHLDSETTCPLSEFSEPLQWVSNHLSDTVLSIRSHVDMISFSGKHWELKTNQGMIVARKVILAIGATPKTLSHNLVNQTKIPLESALNPAALASLCTPKDRVAVFGSSHSAFLTMANLHHLNIPITNFYRSPHCYAQFQGDEILFDNTGLKGFTAEWVKKHIDLPSSKINRVLVSDSKFELEFSKCNKVVYAVGFERRDSLKVKGIDLSGYNSATGVIAPNLFGLGIAFPQEMTTVSGSSEQRIGVWKFLDFLEQVFPQWLATGKPRGAVAESAAIVINHTE